MVKNKDNVVLCLGNLMFLMLTHLHLANICLKNVKYSWGNTQTMSNFGDPLLIR